MEGAQHHAYIYEGSLSQLAALAEDARERFGFPGDNNPDMQVLSHEKFGIEEARDITRAASFKSLSGRALFIIGVSSINSEAQQALLKLFEEPQMGLTFVLLAPHGTVIATLRSRLLAYPGTAAQLSQKSSGRPMARSRAGFQTFAQAAQPFLAATVKDRSAEITKLLKDEEGTKERVRDFLESLEAVLHEALLKTKGKQEIREGLEDIAKVRSYANDRSPSMKMLLEHLAVTLPTLK